MVDVAGTSPFVVHVGRVLRSGEPEREQRRGPIDDLFVTGSEVPAGAEVEVDVLLEPVGRSIQALCARCLKPVAGSVLARVLEVFEDEPVDGETYPLSHSRIDLEPLAREAVVLELPEAPLCEEDCRGLCAQCGADLNEAACPCEAPVDPRWAALDDLRSADD